MSERERKKKDMRRRRKALKELKGPDSEDI